MALPVLLVGLGYSSEKPLDMSEETKGIFDALADKAKVDYLPNLTFDNLRDRFNRGGADEISIFHYIGHSSLHGIYADDGGVPTMIAVQFFSTLLAHQKLKLVFLNSCLSKELAEALCALGVPFVIGTSAEVDNRDATMVATLFYKYFAGAGGSRTVSEAFIYTSNELEKLQKEKKLNRTYVFRGLGSGGQQGQKFAWDIYRQGTSPRDENWTLIPTKQNVESFRNELKTKIENNEYDEVFELIGESSWRYDKNSFNSLRGEFVFDITPRLISRLKVFIGTIK